MVAVEAREEVAAAKGPHAVYAARREERQAELQRLEVQEGRVANARLGVFVLGIAIAWLAFGRDAIDGAWLLLPVVLFAGLVLFHDRLLRRKARRARAVAFYDRGLSRIEGRWAGQGEDGSRFDENSHPYARDLDLFGEGSLFQLLCTARTAAGEGKLASYLLGPAPPHTVRQRQAAVEELRAALDLREELAILGADVRAQVDPERLAAWAEAPPRLKDKGLRALAWLLSILAVATVVGWGAGVFGPLPFVVVLGLELLLLRKMRGVLAEVAGAVERPGRDLAVLSEVLARFEQERPQSLLLADLRARLGHDDELSSRRIRSLAKRIDLLHAPRNQFFAPIAIVLLWSVHAAWAVEDWREASGPRIRGWLDALGELEALSSLASYAYENPGDPFPEIVDTGALYVGRGLAHPLLQGAVANDIRLGDGLQALVVSGSNMSGKSTMLRTVGINAILALAGAPVRAESLRLSPLAIGGTLRVQDSLQEGASRFYAEITRLRQLVSIADGQLPLLFLIDEVLHGTNSHDRRIGAEAVLRGLLDRGAIGLLTTHDLALAQAAEALAPRAENVHFEDRLEDGKLVFDYQMRPGVVKRSNALALMRAVGLDV